MRVSILLSGSIRLDPELAHNPYELLLSESVLGLDAPDPYQLLCLMREP